MHNLSDRPKARPIGPQAGVPLSNEEQNRLIFKPETGAPVSGGMDTFNDPVNVSNSRFVSEENVTNRTSVLSRRAGNATITPAKPDSNKILNFYTTTLFDGSVHQIRFTPSTLYSRGATSWTVFDYNTIPFTGGSNDRFNIITTDNRVFVSNSGIDPIRELDLNANKILVLGNAPQYKYIAVIANRIVGANYTGPSTANPTLVGWSGDANFGEWDPLVDPSAGEDPLLDSQTNYSETITGLFGFESKLLVVRQQSLVLGLLQPSATDPFYFYTAVPGIGSDAPNSIQKVPNGVIFFDRRTRRVYKYDVNGAVDENIGVLVNEVIAEQIDDPESLFSSYDPINHEYQLSIPQASSTNVVVWTYNEITKAWSFDTFDDVSSINNVNFSQASLTIGELVGTIGSLVGTIGELSPNSSTSTRFYCTNAGDILQYDSTIDTDNGSTYTTTIVSKTCELPTFDAYIQKVRIELVVRKNTVITLMYSKNNGVNYTTLKSVTLTASANRQMIIATKHIKARQFLWKLVCTTGLWDIVDYEVQGVKGSPSRT